MLKKLFFITCLCLCFVSQAHAETKNFVKTNTIEFTASATDAGAGMTDSTMSIRWVKIGEIENTFGGWTEPEKFASMFTKTFPDMTDGDYKFQGLFCDSIGNCMLEEDAVETQIVTLDTTAPTDGTFNIKVLISVTIS